MTRTADRVGCCMKCSVTSAQGIRRSFYFGFLSQFRPTQYPQSADNRLGEKLEQHFSSGIFSFISFRRTCFMVSIPVCLWGNGFCFSFRQGHFHPHKGVLYGPKGGGKKIALLKSYLFSIKFCPAFQKERILL